jgi:hypothetical protein
VAEKPRLSSAYRPRATTSSSTPAGRYPYSRQTRSGYATARLRNLVAAGNNYRIATFARPVGGQHATSSSACGGSSGVAGGRSALSTTGGPARSSRHLCRVQCFECAVAADPNARRDGRRGFLPGRVAKQRCAPRPRAFHRRRVVNWQHVVDLDDSGRSELPFMGRPVTRHLQEMASNSFSSGLSPVPHFVYTSARV